MNPFILIPLVALASCSLIMMLVWLWAWRIKNAGVVDIFWAFNFLVIAAVIYLMADGYDVRKEIVCLLAAAWSLRLGFYLLVRVGGHLAEEEGRYKQLRKDWAPNPDRKFFFFFQAQALSNIFLATPFFIIAMNPDGHIGMLEMSGAGLWAISILGEGLADLQLMQFKKDAANKGKVCMKGLWNYSRHPNYFFQFLMWVSIFLLALPSPYGWISAICPVTIFYLIWKVTGIPMTEEQAIRSKGEAYKEYQRTTSVFVPWFKKKGD